jgi:hypothetical protein
MLIQAAADVRFPRERPRFLPKQAECQEQRPKITSIHKGCEMAILAGICRVANL